MRQSSVRPFLRWAGGKRRSATYLVDCLPRDTFNQYYEPFVGSGALFFALAPQRAHLSDSNSELIMCYRWVQQRPDLVIRYLRQHLARTSEEHYYRVRSQYNRAMVRRHNSSAAQAARFIYLNRTSFNGIFRVNLKGEYNVPYGFKEPPPAPDRGHLEAASALLANAKLYQGSFDEVLTAQRPKVGDFVYLDPPYPRLTSKGNFTHYTAPRFTWEDHQRLATFATLLADGGCFVMVSNTDIPQVRDLYSGWTMRELPVTRWLSADGTRYKVTELVITNYVAHRSGRYDDGSLAGAQGH